MVSTLFSTFSGKVIWFFHVTDYTRCFVWHPGERWGHRWKHHNPLSFLQLELKSEQGSVPEQREIANLSPLAEHHRAPFLTAPARVSNDIKWAKWTIFILAYNHHSGTNQDGQRACMMQRSDSVLIPRISFHEVNKSWVKPESWWAGTAVKLQKKSHSMN